jgi:putative drug exporter of the RND superfamily
MCGQVADRSLARMPTSTTSLGRLGAWAADHRRLVVIIWAAALLVLGALAPFADRALSGAGWEAPAAESGEARRAIESRFPGQGTYALSVVVAGERAGGRDRPMRTAVAGVRSVLLSDGAVSGVMAPQPGVTVS